MHRGLPCQSAGLATSGSGSTAASARDSPACGSWIGSVTNSQTASLVTSTRMKKDAMQKLKRCNEMMQGTQNAIRQLNERNNLATIYQRFNYKQANRTKYFSSATYFDPNARIHGLSWNQTTVKKVHCEKEFTS